MTPEQLWARLKPSKDELERMLEARESVSSIFGLSEQECREFNEAFEESSRQFREQHSHLDVAMVEMPVGEGYHRFPVFNPRVVLKEKDLTTGTVMMRPSAMGKSVDQTQRLADVLEEYRVLDEAHYFQGGEASGKSIFHIDKDFYPEPPPEVSDKVSSAKPKPKMTNRYGSPFDFKPRKGKRIK